MIPIPVCNLDTDFSLGSKNMFYLVLFKIYITLGLETCTFPDKDSNIINFANIKSEQIWVA